MRRTHIGIILAGALVGVLAALITARLRHQPAPEPTEFVSADGQAVVELPGEPTPLPCEPEPVADTGNPVLLEPVPMTGIEVTVAHRSAEPAPEVDGAPAEEAAAPEALPMPALVEAAVEEASVGTPVTNAVPSAVPEPVPAPEETPAPGVAVAPAQAAGCQAPAPPEEAPAPGVAVAPPPAAGCQAPAPPHTYQVQSKDGEMMYRIAELQLGNGNRWMEIRDLNPSWRPDQPVPAGTVLLLPSSEEGGPGSAGTPPSGEQEAACASQAVPAATPAAVMRPAPLPLPALVMAAARKRTSHADQVPATGTYECNLEKQAELKLSPSARAELDRPRVLFVALAPDKKCLWVYTMPGIEHLAEQLDHTSGCTEVTHCTRRKCFSRLQPVHATADGTFLLPVELVDMACLKGNVLLIGVRDHFELWDAHQWQQYIGQEEPAEQPESDGGHAAGPAHTPEPVGSAGLPGQSAVQASGPGRLRRAAFFVDGKQAYLLESMDGRAQLYVTAQAGLNLDAYVNRTVDLRGPTIYHGELRSNYMTAATVNLLQ